MDRRAGKIHSKSEPSNAGTKHLGIVRLARGFGASRLEVACLRGLQIGARTYGSVKSILDNRLDGQPVPTLAATTAPDEPPPASVHPNVRGSRYYH